MRELKHIIDGKSYKGTSETEFKMYNPATEEVIAVIQGSSANDVKHAIDVAHDAFHSWKEVTPSNRAHLMFNYRDLLYKHLDELAELVSIEHGKTLNDAKGEVKRGIEIVEYCTSIHTHLKSDFTSNVSSDIDSYNIRQALGVCAGISPFNFPAMVPMWMFPVAIACGNTYIMKLSEKDPSCGLRLTELFLEAGFPSGVLNTVVGDKEAVDELLHNPRVEAISFVGSTPVGEYVYQEGSAHNKRVQALCGAKNHMVVMPDANLDQVCDAVLGAAYGSAGERCMAISVLIFTDNDIADKVIKKLVPMIKNLKVGKYDEKDVDMGPVISKASQTKILDYIDKGLEQGAELVVDGRGIKDKGYYIGGCLFDNVTENMTIYKEEIFGPVLSVLRVDNYNQALDLINSHEYGNGTTIFTASGDVSRHFCMNTNIGMVGVNVPIPVPVAYHSFGGWKRSLFGSHAIHGMEGVRFNTKLKTITSRWPSSIDKGAKFNFESARDHK